MRITGEKSLSSFMKIFINSLILIAFVSLLLLPFITEYYMKIVYYNESSKIYYFILFCLYLSGSLSVVILIQLKRIFNSLKLLDPFVSSNVSSLSIISKCCFFISLIYIPKLFILNSLMTVAIIFVFVIASIFTLILSEVFNQAVIYKKENDYTI